MTRPRCPRGHWLPTTGPCRCTQPRRRRTRLSPDLFGQRIPPGARITTIHPDRSYL